jgi:hypothetical protein
MHADFRAAHVEYLATQAALAAKLNRRSVRKCHRARNGHRPSFALGAGWENVFQR